MKIPLPVTPFDMACHGPRRLEKIEGKWTLSVSNWKLRDLNKHEAMFVEAALAEGRSASAPAMPERHPMIAMVDAAMVEMANIYPPLKRSECERLIRAAMLAAPAAPDDVAKDATRYRWLRQRDWFDSPMCVITAPKINAKLGAYCPSLERLDEAIDAAMLAPASKAPQDKHSGQIAKNRNSDDQAAPALPLVPCPVCGAEAIDKQDRLAEVWICEARPPPTVSEPLTREQAPAHWTEDARAGYVWGWNACCAAMFTALPEVPRG